MNVSMDPVTHRPAGRAISAVQGPLMAVITCLCLFALTEIGLRALDSMRIDYDVEMTRYANEVKTEDPNPRIGHSHRPNVHARLMGVDVSINARGFRDRDYPVVKEAAQRFVFLGDSLTFGWGVEKAATFEELLEKELNQGVRTEVVNFGTGNHNTDQQVQLFIDRGLELMPDRVVLFYFVNDAEPTPRVSRWQRLGDSRAVTWFWSRMRMARTRLGESPDYVRFYNSLYEEGQPGWQVTQAALAELVDVCAERGIRLQVVLLPELHNLKDYPFTGIHQKVAAVLDRLHVEYRDLAPLLVPRTDAQQLWVAPDDAHPNARGHRLIAELTRPFLEIGKGS